MRATQAIRNRKRRGGELPDRYPTYQTATDDFDGSGDALKKAVGAEVQSQRCDNTLSVMSGSLCAFAGPSVCALSSPYAPGHSPRQQRPTCEASFSPMAVLVMRDPWSDGDAP
jgi:hypothetical protein